ncbi:LytR/AlgR family response regulator transcription factor [Pedobacter nototheniae]|uniref:LytR/AlgR family response regulator transcription factor n=1 Tax=Pedobacter nototheniae TaxID=2488994 RepID=UPI002931BD6F|nr:response regulator [Pedobacter nototheniae]
MKKLRCVIIDSDQGSLDSLTGLIEHNPLLTIIKSYTSAVKALFEINEEDDIHFLFTAVKMPDLSGLELVKKLRSKVKFIIFTTSHLHYALKAYQVGADHYLLKPVNQLKLTNTIHQLAYPYQINGDDNLFIEREKKGSFDRLIKADIILIQSTEGFISVVTKAKKLSIHVYFSDVLKAFRNDLRFLRMDNYLVNLNYVAHFSEAGIKLKNGIEICIGEVYEQC